MSNQKRTDPKLRTFIRQRPNGDIILGSAVKRKRQPEGKYWVEISSNTCCSPLTTTTTTIGG